MLPELDLHIQLRFWPGSKEVVVVVVTFFLCGCFVCRLAQPNDLTITARYLNPSVNTDRTVLALRTIIM